MVESIRVTAHRCTCEKCHHTWISITANLPITCPLKSCKSRQWNGAKRRGRPASYKDTSKAGLPKPKRVRPL